MLYPRPDLLQSSPVSRMIVAIDNCFFQIPQNNCQQLLHVLLDGLWIGPPQGHFEFLSTSFLVGGHPALATQLTVGEIDEEVSFLFDGHVVVHGKILAELE